LKDGIRLTRCTQILLSSNNEHVAKFDLWTKLKCPIVNLVHKWLNIDQAFELLQTYGHLDLTGEHFSILFPIIFHRYVIIHVILNI
jgi:hypothetical protein